MYRHIVFLMMCFLSINVYGIEQKNIFKIEDIVPIVESIIQESHSALEVKNNSFLESLTSLFQDEYGNLDVDMVVAVLMGVFVVTCCYQVTSKNYSKVLR